jgi:hypothetical protein
MPGTRSPGDHAGVPQNDVSKAAPRHPQPMLLGAVKGEVWVGEVVVDLAGDVALEATEGF